MFGRSEIGNEVAGIIRANMLDAGNCARALHGAGLIANEGQSRRKNLRDVNRYAQPRENLRGTDRIDNDKKFTFQIGH